MLRENGKTRTSKASKDKKKPKSIKCKNMECKIVFEYFEEDIINASGIRYVECPNCCLELKLK